MNILIAFAPSLIIGAVIVRMDMERRVGIAAARKRGEEMLRAFEQGFEFGREEERLILDAHWHALAFEHRDRCSSREYLAALNWRWIDG